MQSRISYFLMGLGVAYVVQAILKKRATEAAPREPGAKESNVIDLMAWRRDMPGWR